jgi:catechol 2,3-dioxygenase-like lactoylglutathione lyase family enzyme
MSIARTHLILYVRDQDASAVFYRRVLGTEPLLDVPGMTEFALSDGAVLGLMPEAGIARLLRWELLPNDPAALRAELYLVVQDPGAIHARALAAGARELSPLLPRDWGAEVAYSLDPDGYVLAFARNT